MIKPAVNALGSAGLSFGAEKALRKIFGNGYGPNEIQLYKLVQKMTPDQKKAVEKYLVGRGMASGSGQYGGFLGMLARARPLIKLAVNALASVGLSFGTEKALKKIFGNGYGPNEIQLYKLVQKMTPDHFPRGREGGGGYGGGGVELGGLFCPFSFPMTNCARTPHLPVCRDNIFNRILT